VEADVANWNDGQELLAEMRNLIDHLEAAPDPGSLDEASRRSWRTELHRRHVQALDLCEAVLPDVGEAHRQMIHEEIQNLRAALQRRGQRVAAVFAAPNN
jgi:hypothetical protein